MYIRAAEWNDDDYIRVGNLMLPKDASGYGNMTGEEISRSVKKDYERELARRAEEEKRLADIARGKANYDMVFFATDSTSVSQKPSDTLDDMFEVAVPPQGQCDNIGCELIRAMMRVMYRDYNDGDVFYQGYGLETCCSDAAFVMDNTDDEIYRDFMNIAENGYEDNAYTQALENITGKLIEFLRNNPEIFGKDTVDCRSYHSGTVDEIEEAAPEYEFDIDVSWELDDFVNRGCIDWDDVESWLNELAEYDYGGEVGSNWGGGSYIVTELSKEEYDNWEDSFSSSLNSYKDDLVDEYTDGDYWSFSSAEEWAKFIGFACKKDWRQLLSQIESDAEYGLVVIQNTQDYQWCDSQNDDKEDIKEAYEQYFELDSDEDEDEGEDSEI